MKKLCGLRAVAVLVCVAVAGPVLADDANAPDSPTARAVRDWEQLRAEVEKFPEKLIAEANRKAEGFDGKTWLDSETFKRVMYFVPAPKSWKSGEPIPDIIIPELSLLETPKAPPGAVERGWQDRFALAQQYSYRYRFGGVTKLLRKEDMDKPFEATFEIKITATVRSGWASEVKPVPETPEGMVPVTLIQSRFFGSGGGKGLWAPPMPGEADRKPADELEREALAAMKAAPSKVVKGALICHVVYDAVAGKWVWKGCDWKDRPDPSRLDWSIGLPKDKKPYIRPPPPPEPTTQDSQPSRTGSTPVKEPGTK